MIAISVYAFLYISDIRNIMHAFGDSSEPCEESIEFMEMILRLELGGFLYLCDSAVAITRSKVLGLREAIFTMKNDKPRLLRLFKYFGKIFSGLRNRQNYSFFLFLVKKDSSLS